MPFVQFKKREKHPWRSVILLYPATLLKITILHGCFSRFLNCRNRAKRLIYKVDSALCLLNVNQANNNGSN